MARRRNPQPPKSAQEHLADFEKEHLPDARRHHGQVEKGKGSHWDGLPHEHKQRHAALEEFVQAEAAVARAKEAHDAAVAAHAKVAQRAGLVLVDTDEADAPHPGYGGDE